ncbi:MFS transporter [Kitasatospora sp. LaBMicrA B282]|uniref:MFS transporter n=1 Tax=Kitasatospora sp. LaBMicrA B282 TaxID=3420949 RepID=UPI003D149EC0
MASTTTSPAPSRLLLPLLCACVVLTVGMVASINLAIPKIAASALHPSSAGLLWIVDCYVIVFAGLLIPAGVLGDHYGHRRALTAGLAVFTLGAGAAAASGTVGELIAARVVMGVGAALILPATLSVIVGAIEPARRPHAIATWAAMTGLGGVAGNAVGGLVLQFLPWQALFLVVAPISLLFCRLAATTVPDTPLRGTRQDPVGAALLTAALLALLYGIIEGPDNGWGSLPVLTAFAAAAVLLAGFVGYELRHPHPLLDPRLFRLPKVRAGALGIGTTFFGMFALFYVNAQYLQYVKGYSVLATGLGIAPLALAMLLVSRRTVPLVRRFGPRAVAISGLLLVSAGLLLLSLADRHTPYPLYALALVVMAAGAGLSMPPLSTGIVGSLPPEQAGLGSGLNSSTRELGSALGVAVVGTVLNGRFTGAVPAGLRGPGHSTADTLAHAATLDPAGRAQVLDAFTRAMDTGFRLVAALLLVATGLVWLWYRERPARAGGAVTAQPARAGAPAEQPVPPVRAR